MPFHRVEAAYSGRDYPKVMISEIVGSLVLDLMYDVY